MRKVISAMEAVEMIRGKAASGFVPDFSDGAFLSPTLTKITDSDALKLYRNNEWVHAVVNRIVDDCVKVTPRVVLKDQTKRATVKQQNKIDEVKMFLDDPNENKESFREIREKFIRDMEIYGRGAQEKVVSIKSRRIAEIYAAQVRQIKPKVNRHGMLPKTRTYEHTDPKSERKTFYDKDEMIYLVLTPTTDTIFGFKRLDALSQAVAADILRATYNGNFFINGAEAAGILSLENMSKPQLTKFRQYWNSAHKGARKAHKIAAVNVPAKWTRMALTNRDLEFSEYGRELRSKIFAVFGMQPLVMGIIDPNTGRLNSQEQMQAYKDGALKPILTKEAYVYTKELIEAGFGFRDLKIDFAEVDLADTVEQATIDRNDLQAGILTINEIRARRGLAPVKWGDAPIMILPGGGQIDPDSGRLIMPDGNNTQSSSNEKKNVDVAANMLSSYFRICAGDDMEVNQKRIDKIVEATSTGYKEETYMWYLAEKLSQRYGQYSAQRFLERLDEIVKGSHESVFYYNCPAA